MTTATRPRPTSSRGLRTRRLAFLLPGAIALLAGLDAALLLLDLPAPVTADRLPEVHGMVLVIGFVGTLISLERTVALRARAGFLAPALLGLGALAVVSPLPLRVGQLLWIAGSIAFIAVYSRLWRRQRDEATLMQTVGAVMALGACVLWHGGVPVATLLPWLVAFIVLTIVGERLELARLELSAAATGAAVALAGALLVGVVTALLWPWVGYRLTGLVLLALTVTMAGNDVARRTIRASGLPRFTAACMLAGYAWLAVAAGVWLLDGAARSGASYDAVIHAVFLGFTLSMIMAHASVILPAVLHISLPYHWSFTIPAVLLHGSLGLRILVGDAWGVEWAWRLGGALNIVAVLLFLLLAAGTAVRATRSPR